MSCEDTGYGMFVRHVKGLAVRDMVLTTDKSDARRERVENEAF